MAQLGAWVALAAAACSPPPGILEFEGPAPLFEIHWPLGGRGCAGIAPRLADATGDGRPELLVFATALDRGQDPGTLAELRDPATGAVVVSFASPRPSAATDCTARFVGDLDGDEREDVALVVDSAGGYRTPGDAVWVFSSSGSPLFEVRAESAEVRFARALAPAGDVDGDGSNDFALIERRTRGVSTSWSNDVVFISGRDGERLDVTLPVGGVDVEIDELVPLGDVDGDGGIDIAVRMRPVLPSDAYCWPCPPPLPETTEAIERARRGPQLCAISCTPPRIVWLMPAEPAAVFGSGAMERTSDFDGDGIADLLLQTEYGARVVSARTGEGLERLDVGGDRAVLGEVGDWDGDGEAELLVQSYEMRSLLWDRQFYAWFQVVSRPKRELLGEVGLGAPFVNAIACQDLDSDGLADFVVESGRSVRAFSRRCFMRN